MDLTWQRAVMPKLAKFKALLRNKSKSLRTHAADDNYQELCFNNGGKASKLFDLISTSWERKRNEHNFNSELKIVKNLRREETSTWRNPNLCQISRSTFRMWHQLVEDATKSYKHRTPLGTNLKLLTFTEAYLVTFIRLPNEVLYYLILIQHLVRRRIKTWPQHENRQINRVKEFYISINCLQRFHLRAVAVSVTTLLSLSKELITESLFRQVCQLIA